jgi:hypothetical protein
MSDKRDSMAGLNVNGHATGSAFYPHGSLNTGGVSLNQYGQVVTGNIESPSKSNEKHRKPSPRKVVMPEIANLH